MYVKRPKMREAAEYSFHFLSLGCVVGIGGDGGMGDEAEAW